jgi:hypothetical protein
LGMIFSFASFASAALSTVSAFAPYAPAAKSMRKRLLRRLLPILPEFYSLLFLECWPTDDHTHPGISSYSVSSYLKVAW